MPQPVLPVGHNEHNLLDQIVGPLLGVCSSQALVAEVGHRLNVGAGQVVAPARRRAGIDSRRTRKKISAQAAQASNAKIRSPKNQDLGKLGIYVGSRPGPFSRPTPIASAVKPRTSVSQIRAGLKKRTLNVRLAPNSGH